VDGGLARARETPTVHLLMVRRANNRLRRPDLRAEIRLVVRRALRAGQRVEALPKTGLRRWRAILDGVVYFHSRAINSVSR
jgi:hypothetical protein